VHDTPAVANREFTKLEREKRKKGYREPQYSS
jgi:predicted DNA-binding WGR domain protein